jgi:pimeloyl-ACP methyl ester carboxylesterase
MLQKLALIFLGLLLFGTVLLLAWYRIDGIPVDDTRKFLIGNGYTYTQDADGDLLFTPDTSNGDGIVIMHGALIMPQSYAKSAAFFARLGYTVYLPNGRGRLSITAVDKVAERLQDFDIKDWYFIGHSMGGMASLETISRHGIQAKAVALWATAMPSDYSDKKLPILFIWGDHDGLLPVERFKMGQSNLPADVEYVTLPGANHRNFAMYSHQFFDNDATIDWMQQIDFANETTATFFAKHQGSPGGH